MTFHLEGKSADAITGASLAHLLKHFSTEKFIDRDALLEEFQRVLRYLDVLNTEDFVSPATGSELREALLLFQEKLKGLQQQFPEKVFESQFGELSSKIRKYFADFSKYAEKNKFEGRIDNTFAYTEAIMAVVDSFQARVKALYENAESVVPPALEVLHESPYERAVREWAEQQQMDIEGTFPLDRSAMASHPAFKDIKYVSIVPPEAAPKISKAMRLVIPQGHVLVTPAQGPARYLTIPLSALKQNLSLGGTEAA